MELWLSEEEVEGYLPSDHLASAFEVFTSFKPRVACDQLLKHRIQLVLCTHPEFDCIHEVNE